MACPFWLWPNFHEITHLAEETMGGVVTGLGLPEPTPTVRRIAGQNHSFIDWPAWWDRVVRIATAEQLDSVWALFEEGRLVEVVAMEMEG